MKNNIKFQYSKVKSDENGEYKTVSFDFYLENEEDIEKLAEELKNRFLDDFLED